MNYRICEIPSCANKHHSHGFCRNHSNRYRRYGDPLAGRIVYSTPEEAFSNHTVWVDGCLIWTRAKNALGYGTLQSNNKLLSAHVFAWESNNGPIPGGHEIDHICWNPSCVNIDHLRLATTSENQSNRSGASSRSSVGVRNVYKNGNKWKVQLRYKGEHKYYGTFDSITEAAVVAEQARKDLFGEFAGRG